MTMTIQGFGGSYVPDRRPNAGKRRRASETEELAAGASTQLDSNLRKSWSSEQSRAGIAAVAQAIQAAETAKEIVEVASGGLGEISNWLAAMRREIEQAAALATADEDTAGEATAGDNTARRLAAHQSVMAQSREELAELVNSVQFGRMRLLDGGLGCTGNAFGEGLDFVRGSAQSRASSPEGYPVWIRQEATRASALVPVELTPAQRRRPPTLAIEENGLRAEFTPQPGQALGDIASGLRQAAEAGGLRVVVEEGPCGQLLVRHMKYGAAHRITLGSPIPGVFSHPDGTPLLIDNGQDVVGSINGEPGLGEGQILTGCAGNRTTDGLAVRFTGQLPISEDTELVMESLDRLGMGLSPEEMSEWQLMGRVILAQQPFMLRLGAGERQVISIRLNSMHPRRLGLGVDNASGFRSLADLRLNDAATAHSALLVLTRAEEEVQRTRTRLEELRGPVLTGSLAGLRAEAERQQHIYTNIADGQRARQVARDLSSYMQSRGPAALIAQMQPLPGAMVRLLTDEAAQAPGLGREC